MKIWSVKIDGVAYDPYLEYTQEQIDSAGVDLDKFMIAADTAPSPAYEDITSIKNWAYQYAFPGIGKSYGYMREQLKVLVATKTVNFTQWNNLTDEEKDIACRFIVAPYALRTLTVTEDQDKENWIRLIALTKAFRGNVIEKGREVISDYLRTDDMSYAESDQFYEDTELLLDRYYMTDNREFQAWLQDQPPYDQGNGFSSKSYYTAERQTKLINIFVNYEI